MGFPVKWITATAKDIADILDNRRIPVNSDERQKRNTGKSLDSLFPYYGATGQVDVIDDFIFEGEHVLLGEDGAPFLDILKPKAYIAKGKFWVNNHAHILRAKDSIATNSFLMHYFNICNFQGFVTGTTRLKLNQQQLTSIPLPLPPLPEQHRIVAKIEELFSDLDAGIASLRKAKEQLKIYRQSVLKWAFEGKLTEEWRKKRLNGDSGDSHDEDGFKNHGNHKNHKNYRADNLPAGWEWVNVSEILTDSPTNGRSVPTRKGGFRVLRLTALGDKFIDITQFKEGDWTEAEAKPYLLRRNDFLVCRGNCSLHLVGRGCLVLSDCMMAYPDTLIRLRCSPEVIDTSFLYAVWISRIVRDQIETTARTTAGIFKINQKDIGRIRLPIPPLAEQIEIISEIESRLSVADNLEKTIDTSLTQAAALRQSILKRAFEGKLVPQDSKDEPAEKLLERIKAEQSHFKSILKTREKKENL